MAFAGITSFTSLSVRRFKTCKIDYIAMRHQRCPNSDNRLILVEEKDQVGQCEECLTQETGEMLLALSQTCQSCKYKSVAVRPQGLISFKH